MYSEVGLVVLFMLVPFRFQCFALDFSHLWYNFRIVCFRYRWFFEDEIGVSHDGSIGLVADDIAKVTVELVSFKE